MARKFLRRYLPNADTLRHHRHLGVFGRWLQRHPNLWSLNRRSVSVGLAIGLFMAFVPMPMQMVPATGAALLLHANIPAAIAGVWVTNPLTIPPLAVLCYHVGAWALGIPAGELGFEFSLDGLTGGLGRAWGPFLLGCLIVGMASAATGYVTIRLLWRWQVVQAWGRRKTTKNLKPKKP
jgi:uncharacterized protein (DUF2062 family)